MTRHDTRTTTTAKTDQTTPDKQSVSAKTVLSIAVLTFALTVSLTSFLSGNDPRLAIANAQVKAQDALAQYGYDWAKVKVADDGTAVLTGEAPGEAQRVIAYQAVRAAMHTVTDETALVTDVKSQITLAAVATPAVPVPVVAAATSEPAKPAGPQVAATVPPLQSPIETSAISNAPPLVQADCKAEFVDVLSKSTIAFGIDSAKIEKRSTAVLDQLAAIAKRCAGYKLTVEGHTDNTGKTAHNRDLSQKRAEAVRDALVNRGVENNALAAKGYGASKPIASGKSVSSLAKNRRIEFAVSAN